MDLFQNHDKNRIDELRRELNRHNELYYNKATPEISDHEYDMLMKELEELEAKYPELFSPDSPTQRVGAPLIESSEEGTEDGDDRREKVRHEIPMLSISNTYTDDEVRKFVGRVIAALEQAGNKKEPEFVVELKIDGLAISIIYENGKLLLGATRGDGKVGEDVTENVRRVKNIPATIENKSHIEVRGEIYMPRQAFERVRQEQEDSGADRVFANPRNAAAGTLKV
ncbi:MAG: NAD-dependent DNA ligase LigA, partial [Planctomycetes bacterium]|nr:NAD-dependent DNA ligase LigA [Planctomycetota bacterium]